MPPTVLNKIEVLLEKIYRTLIQLIFLHQLYVGTSVLEIQDKAYRPCPQSSCDFYKLNLELLWWQHNVEVKSTDSEAVYFLGEDSASGSVRGTVGKLS